MKKTLTKLLCALALCLLAGPVHGLVIIPTFDTSITTDVNGAAIMTAITNAILVFQSKVADDGTVKILFKSDPTTSLGASDTWGDDYDYQTFLTALRSHASSVNDTNGLSHLPNSSTDPVAGGNQVYVNTSLARCLGLLGANQYGNDGYDSTISLNMTKMNFTRPPGNANKYDVAEVAEHEMDEVLGTPSDLPDYPEICPIDLFRYTTNLVRTYATTGDDAYFSVDGTNLLARFNMHAGGDFADWWSYNDNWAPPGFTPVPQVQDAYGTSGIALDIGSNELAMLDVIGWTLIAPAQPVAPVLKINHTGVNQFTLSWSNNVSGYVLQERTNLVSGNWVASASGSTDPAVTSSTNGTKFYRLYKAAGPAAQQAHAGTFSQATGPNQHRIRVLRLPKP